MFPCSHNKLKILGVYQLSDKKLRLRFHIPFFALFLSAAPLIVLTYFNVMCEEVPYKLIQPIFLMMRKTG